MGATIATLRAHDADTGENSQLTYRFTDEYFLINEYTGAVMIFKDIGPLCNTFSQHAELDVVVSDGGRLPLSSAMEFDIMVYDCEDYLPPGM